MIGVVTKCAVLDSLVTYCSIDVHVPVDPQRNSHHRPSIQLMKLIRACLIKKGP